MDIKERTIGIIGAKRSGLIELIKAIVSGIA